MVDLETQLKAAMDKGKFREWLVAQKPRATVGSKGHPNSCPIATYLKEKFPNHGPCVGWASTIRLGYKGTWEATLDHMAWSKQFVFAVDDDTTPNAIRRERALSILDAINFR